MSFADDTTIFLKTLKLILNLDANLAVLKKKIQNAGSYRQEYIKTELIKQGIRYGQSLH